MTAKQKRTFSIGGIALLVIGGIIAAAVFGFTARFAGFVKAPEKPNTSADAAARQFEGRSDLTDPAYLDKVAKAGLADAEKRGWVPTGVPDLNGGGFTQPAPGPKSEAVASGEWPIKDRWTIQTPRGPLAVVYRATNSAKDVSFRVENGKMIIKNKLDRPTRLIYFTKFNGEVNSSDTPWAANEEVINDITAFGITGTLEVWIEVKS